MFFLYIITVIIVAYLIHSQSVRIDNLENLVKGNKVIPNIPNAPTTYGSIPKPPQGQSMPNVSSVSSSIAASNEEESGRLLGKLGIGAVLLGVAFFLKYAFDNNWIGPEGRVLIGIIVGLGFLSVGHFLRAKYLRYSDLLMGGGIAILYLSIYAAHSYYNLIDPTFTGLALFAVTILSFVLSIFDATITLSFVAVVGAAATPFLVGSHQNNMLELFGYLIIINLGVLAVSFFKQWPSLVLATFVGTAINFIVWFGAFYSPSELGPTMFFVIVSFFIFLAASLARITSNEKIRELDYFILIANAFALTLLSYIILRQNYHSFLGISSVCVAVIYFIVALFANNHRKEEHELNIFLAGLSVAFLSMAVPLQFNGEWIPVLWFIESVVLYFMASIVGNRGFQVMGAVVYILGMLDFIKFLLLEHRGSEYTPIFNQDFALFLLSIVAAYAIAYVYKRFGSTTLEIQKRGLSAFVIVANILTIIAVTQQIMLYYSLQLNSSADYITIANSSHTAVSIFWTLYAALLTVIGFSHRKADVRRFGLILFIITAFKVLFDVWQLGPLYRIISFIAFGIIALVASFLYAKYKDRLKDIV